MEISAHCSISVYTVRFMYIHAVMSRRRCWRLLGSFNDACEKKQFAVFNINTEHTFKILCIGSECKIIRHLIYKNMLIKRMGCACVRYIVLVYVNLRIKPTGNLLIALNGLRCVASIKLSQENFLFRYLMYRYRYSYRYYYDKYRNRLCKFNWINKNKNRICPTLIQLLWCTYHWRHNISYL